MGKKLCGTNYPVSIAFVVVNEFCERFSYYGMKAVLTLYFINYLHWSQDLSTSVYHAFSSLCYFTPVLGAIIADSWLGKFKTIIYLSIIYVIGHIVKSVGAIPLVGDNTMHIALSMVGLILIAFGTGGIKPCVAAFGGDQFDEEHTNERRKFFSIFYLSINAGSLLSTVITPLLRADVQCFGGDCYALAFGVPAALMIVALVVFIAGSGLYKKNPPEGNVLLDVCKCIGFAIKNRCRSSKYDRKRKHWLDWAEEKYSRRLIEDIKMTLRVLLLYIPLPMFWALFDQQGSRWTLQTTRMNMAFAGSLVLQPDQMQMLNALMIILFIPVFDFVIYPLIALCGINLTPLKKMAVGMIIAALAFCAAAVVELNIMKTVVEPAPQGECLLQVYNLADVDVRLNIPGSSQVQPIAPYEDPAGYHRLSLGGHNKTLPIEIIEQLTGSLHSCSQNFTEEKAYSILLHRSTSGIQCQLVTDHIEKDENGDAYLRFINARQAAVNLTVGGVDFHIPAGYSTSPSHVVSRGEYSNVQSGNFIINLGLLDFGASYTIVLKESSGGIVKMEDVLANDVHIGWQIPQYVLITAGEVMFSITGLEFSYSQAPVNMKSVLQAGWLLTVAFGNIIVPVVAAGGLVQWMEFLLFAGLLVAVCIIFSIMAFFYTYVDPEKLDKLFHEDNVKKINETSNLNNLEQSTKL